MERFPQYIPFLKDWELDENSVDLLSPQSLVRAVKSYHERNQEFHMPGSDVERILKTAKFWGEIFIFFQILFLSSNLHRQIFLEN
jgi:hypothetical protein